MSEPTPYRQLARRTLEQAANELNVMPVGPMPTDEFQARSAKAQAIATIAIGYALVEIGDVLRAGAATDEDGS
jgi:hypothetical protein